MRQMAVKILCVAAVLVLAGCGEQKPQQNPPDQTKPQ